jgi:hypothetical protein
MQLGPIASAIGWNFRMWAISLTNQTNDRLKNLISAYAKGNTSPGW